MRERERVSSIVLGGQIGPMGPKCTSHVVCMWLRSDSRYSRIVEISVAIESPHRGWERKECRASPWWLKMWGKEVRMWSKVVHSSRVGPSDSQMCRGHSVHSR